MTWSTPDDRQIKDILANRIDVEHDGVGMVVGVIDASGPRVVSHGSFARDAERPPTGETLFEIGSCTKVFTALLLAEMAERDEVRFSDPVTTLLPPGVKVPGRGGRHITLLDLATHVSGLPRDADNYGARRRANPFADYTVERLYEFLGRYELRHDIGAQPSYSNIGMGLLGHALARRAGVDFEALIRARITGPLGMTGTAIALTPELRARCAIGHDAERQPVANLDNPAIPGAGAHCSTAKDLLVFLAAALGHLETSLASAMAAQLAVRIDTAGGEFRSQALGWGVSTEGGRDVAWHVGRTSGFRCFMGFAPQTGVGVVVLGNMATRRAGEDIGMHLLTGKPIPAVVHPSSVRLGAEALQAFVGRFRIRPEREITVSVEDGRLVFAPPGRGYAFHASGPTSFFLKQFDVQVDFELDRDGRATALLIRQNGRESRAGRIE